MRGAGTIGARRLAALGSTSNEVSPHVSGDGLTIYFESSRLGSPDLSP